MAWHDTTIDCFTLHYNTTSLRKPPTHIAMEQEVCSNNWECNNEQVLDLLGCKRRSACFWRWNLHKATTWMYSPCTHKGCRKALILYRSAKDRARHDWAMRAMIWIPPCKEHEVATNEQETGHNSKSITKSWQRHYLKVAKESNSNFHHYYYHFNQNYHSCESVTKACARLWRHISTQSSIGCKQSIT